jgi:hypothetical protein
LAESLTRVTGEIFHCRRGKANFFFFAFMLVSEKLSEFFFCKTRFPDQLSQGSFS